MRRARGMTVVALLVAAGLAAAGCSAAGGASVVTQTATVSVTPTPTAPAATSTAPPTVIPGSAERTLSSSPDPTNGKAAATTPTVAPKPVHASFFEGDGQTYGVGMAIMVLFTVAPTDSTAFVHAATVTVNGKPANGAWYWQKPQTPGYQLEALYRPQSYWPAHASIEVVLPVAGLSAGPGLAYDDNLTLAVQTGAANVSTVNNVTHEMTVTSDGKVVKEMPVSLGAADTPTYDGTKVIMEKDNPVRMVSAPGEPYYNVLVPWSLRITDSGEFVHAASWNTGNIGSRNTSHGCTNLDPNDAQWFFNFSQIGDVVLYPNANPNGTVQPSWDGWGWWNVPWSVWTQGGMLHAGG